MSICLLFTKTFHLNLVGSFRGKVTMRRRAGGVLPYHKIFLYVLLLKYKEEYKKLDKFLRKSS